LRRIFGERRGKRAGRGREDGDSSQRSRGNCLTLIPFSVTVQGLANVFIVKFRVLSLEFGAVRIRGKGFEDAANRQPEASNTWLAVHLAQVNRDPVEFFHGGSHFRKLYARRNQRPGRECAAPNSLRIPEATMEIIGRLDGRFGLIDTSAMRRVCLQGCTGCGESVHRRSIHMIETELLRSS
jgi:hypothetical protein